MSWKAARHLKRYNGRNRHHLVPRSRNGENHVSNLLLIDIDKHYFWHRIFGLRTLEEVIEVLTRLKGWKEHQRVLRTAPRVSEVREAPEDNDRGGERGVEAGDQLHLQTLRSRRRYRVRNR